MSSHVYSLSDADKTAWVISVDVLDVCGTAESSLCGCSASDRGGGHHLPIHHLFYDGLHQHSAAGGAPSGYGTEEEEEEEVKQTTLKALKHTSQKVSPSTSTIT